MNNLKKVRWSMLLSHHPPQQYCRTYKIFDFRVCARCSGIPIGIALMMFVKIEVPFWTLFFLPLPTFLNFLLQELKLIPSLNILKTFLTILLGVSLFEIFLLLKNGNFPLCVLFISYLFVIEFIIALILNKQNKLEPLVELYEENIYKEN